MFIVSVSDIRHQILEFAIEYYISKTVLLVIFHNEAHMSKPECAGDTDL